MWRAVRRGTATGRFAIVAERPFAGRQSQQLSFDSGEGQWGVENQGLNRWGMNFVAGKTYEGYVWARAEKPATLFAALESRDGSQVYAETPLAVAGSDWQRLDFTLTPSAADTGRALRAEAEAARRGRAGLCLSAAGRVGPVQGAARPPRCGRGPDRPGHHRAALRRLDGQQRRIPLEEDDRPARPPPALRRAPGIPIPPTAGASSISWTSARRPAFEYVPAFNMDETPQDMADFIEYAKGPADSAWGRRRAADGHPQPYRLNYMELGNEERVDEKYAAKFEALAEAIWAKDPEIILVVGDFVYDRPSAIR